MEADEHHREDDARDEEADRQEGGDGELLAREERAQHDHRAEAQRRPADHRAADQLLAAAAGRRRHPVAVEGIGGRRGTYPEAASHRMAMRAMVSSPPSPPTSVAPMGSPSRGPARRQRDRRNARQVRGARQVARTDLADLHRHLVRELHDGLVRARRRVDRGRDEQRVEHGQPLVEPAPDLLAPQGRAMPLVRGHGLAPFHPLGDAGGDARARLRIAQRRMGFGELGKADQAPQVARVLDARGRRSASPASPRTSGRPPRRPPPPRPRGAASRS